MNVNRMQASTLRTLTNRIQRFCMPDEVMHYRLEKSAHNDDLILTASNSGSPWYAKHKHATIFIGPRGGVDRKFSDVAEISPRLLKC
jgi:hypothetical protein